MKVARGRLLRNLAGSAGVLLVVVALAFGLPAVDRSLPSQRPVSAEPYEVGAGVTVVPPEGALLDVTLTRPGDQRGTAVFVVGAVRYVIVVTPFDGDLDAAVDRLRRKITGVRGHQVTGKEFPTTTASGLEGRQGGYSAPGRGGRYVVFRTGGIAIEVTVAGTDLQLRNALARIEESTRTITYRAPA